MLRHEQFDGWLEFFQSKLCSKIFSKRVSIAVDNDHSRRESISLKHPVQSLERFKTTD